MTAQDYLNNRYEYEPTTGIIKIKYSKDSWNIGKVVGKAETPMSGSTPRGGGPYMRFGLLDSRTPGNKELREQLKLPVRGMVHRIAWIMVHGDIPKGHQIDHIDHNGLNNKLENLRCITAQQNQRNRKLDIRNKSGHNGIRNRFGSYEVYTKNYSKHVQIGTYGTIEEAMAARDAYYKAENFHENHGKSGS